MSNFPIIFDRKKVKKNRNRFSPNLNKEVEQINTIGLELCDRLSDVKKKFKSALVLGDDVLKNESYLRNKYKIEKVVCGDLSYKRLKKISNKIDTVCLDEELLPFKENIFDLIIANFCLQWANDLPGSLIQLRRLLKPDGLFIATLPGGSTLSELRESFNNAEMEIKGGVTPRVSPFVDIKDAGNLLIRTGFSLPVAEKDLYTLKFDNLMLLFNALRSYGQSNVLVERCKNLTTLNLFKKVEDFYLKRFSLSNNQIQVSLEVITLTGWSPSGNQQKPLTPGSAQHSLSDFVK